MKKLQAWAAALQGSAQTPGPLITMIPCFQLDPQALQDRDWQRTVIAMNGVCTTGLCLCPLTPEG